jgi:hypothetical protein
VQDLGLIETSYGQKEKVRLIWVTAHKNERGENITVQGTYTRSLHEKSALAKAIKGITGSVPQKLDLEALIGTCSQLVIQHNENDGRVYANVSLILKTNETMAIPATYKSRDARRKEIRNLEDRTTEAARRNSGVPKVVIPDSREAF